MQPKTHEDKRILIRFPLRRHGGRRKSEPAVLVTASVRLPTKNGSLFSHPGEYATIAYEYLPVLWLHYYLCHQLKEVLKLSPLVRFKEKLKLVSYDRENAQQVRRP